MKRILEFSMLEFGMFEQQQIRGGFQPFIDKLIDSLWGCMVFIYDYVVFIMYIWF